MANAKKKTMAEVFRVTFSGEDGKTMLYWILQECGYFETNPNLISPELTSFANRLLSTGGVNQPQMAGRFVDEILRLSSEYKEEEVDEI